MHFRSRQVVQGLWLGLGLVACGGEVPDDVVDWEPIPEDLRAQRAELVEHVFRGDVVPTSGADEVIKGIADDVFDGIEQLGRLDALRFDLDFGLWSRAYLFHPNGDVAKGRLLVYHLGHFEGFDIAEPIVRFFVDRGFTVLLHAMPLFGPNPGDIEITVDGETFALPRDHESFEPLEVRGYNVMHLFFEPLARSITHVLERGSYADVTFVGLSGGGWTTDVYSALDPRVTTSYSVAGSLPHALREPRDIGEFEQLEIRPLYDIASFMDIYLLASIGEPYRHRQILFEHDACCFAWRGRAGAIRDYELRLRDALEAEGVGGDFRIDLLPDLVEHRVHPEVMTLIAEELEG